MTWSTVHDEMLCREILVVVDPFTGTKKGTVARGTKGPIVNYVSVGVGAVVFKKV